MGKAGRYKKAKNYIISFNNVERMRGGPERYELELPELHRFQKLLMDNGAPHLQYSVVHVAGTKGKGSTTALMESVLRHSGLRTGSFVNPRIYEVTEEINLNGTNISRNEFVELFDTFRGWVNERDKREGLIPNPITRLIHHLYDKYNGPKSSRKHCKRAFDMITATGFQYWARHKVDVAVVETGLGGRLDPTNIFTEPPRVPGGFLVNIITPMGLEHTHVFGNTIEEILYQKMGIIQPHGITVLTAQKERFKDKVKSAVRQRTLDVQGIEVFDSEDLISLEVVDPAPPQRVLFRANVEKLKSWAEAARKARPTLKAIDDLELFQALEKGLELNVALSGRHQADNMRSVLGAALCAGMQGLKVPIEGVVNGAAATKWPGRFEVLSRDPLIIADVAHEALSATALGETYKATFGDRETVALCGFERDKDADTILRNVGAHVNFVSGVCCTSPMAHRARPAVESKPMMEAALQVPIVISDPVEAATETAISVLKPGQALLVFGSFYIIAKAKAAVLRKYANEAKRSPEVTVTP